MRKHPKYSTSRERLRQSPTSSSLVALETGSKSSYISADQQCMRPYGRTRGTNGVNEAVALNASAFEYVCICPVESSRTKDCSSTKR